MIDFQEFIISLGLCLSENMQERLDWIFQAYDQNGDGRISFKEFKNIIKVL